MSTDKIIISGTGCALADFLYNGISFDSPAFKEYQSKKTGDGGLSPGKLVFTEELEKFAGRPYREIVKEIMGDRPYDAFNVGGPSLVSLIHVSQLLDNKDYEVKFFGIAGKDETADKIFEIIRQTPLNIENYTSTPCKVTPFTDVLSDPDFDHGHGERTFVNNIGAAWDYFPEQLTPEFFSSDIACFGGTALVPQIHDNLTLLLEKAKKNGCITVVNTVFDFRNEKANPEQPWPLVSSFESYGLIDVLIMDCDEALRISGQKTIEEASGFFASTGVSSFIITNGAKDLVACSRGGFFEKTELIRIPVSIKVTDELKSNPRRKGDTTGCGDNFAGGIIASIAWQLKARDKGYLNLVEALSWGIASGGFCCFTVGGTYLEKAQGEKIREVQSIQREYLNQIGC
ncbi:MAG: carbohydrate kinase family protein [Bacteroidia bacterium]|nr:carbohydrate kinase family protein [Bacteroidia bacterium]